MKGGQVRVSQDAVDRVVYQGVLQLHNIIDDMLDDRQTRQFASFRAAWHQLSQLVQVLSYFLSLLPHLWLSSPRPDIARHLFVVPAGRLHGNGSVEMPAAAEVGVGGG